MQWGISDLMSPLRIGLHVYSFNEALFSLVSNGRVFVSISHFPISTDVRGCGDVLFKYWQELVRALGCPRSKERVAADNDSVFQMMHVNPGESMQSISCAMRSTSFRSVKFIHNRFGNAGYKCFRLLGSRTL